MKKILFIYGSYGSGHKSIAEAIASYFEENSEYEIKILDVAKYSNFSGRATLKLFDYVANHRRELFFNSLYEIFDNKLISLTQGNSARRYFDNKHLRKEIKDFNPDLTISTHFYGTAIISLYNKKGLINSKIVTVLTDYAYHHFWRIHHKDTDAYIVASEVMKKQMVDDKIDGRKVYPVGMPFNQSKLLNVKPRSVINRVYGLDPNKKTYAFFAGGAAGMMAYYKYFKSLALKRYSINLLFICGNNKELEAKSRKFVKDNKLKNVKIYGFIQDVYSVINAADYVISKTGAATVTECLIMHCPLIAIPGVGGQEKYNAKFVVKKGYGLRTRGTNGLNKTVLRTLNHPELGERFKNNLSKIKPNHSLEKILKIVDRLIK